MRNDAQSLSIPPLPTFLLWVMDGAVTKVKKTACETGLPIQEVPDSKLDDAKKSQRS